MPPQSSLSGGPLALGIANSPFIVQGEKRAWLINPAKPIGEGSQGLILAGHAIEDPSVKVCCKVFTRKDDGKHLAAFRRESQALEQLNSKAAVPVLLDVAHSPEPMLLLELVHGQNFREMRSQGLKGVSTRKLAARLLNAVAGCHAQGFAHRDIKLENIMLRNDEVVLVDFGLAESSVMSTLKCGSPYYAAPEIIFSPHFNTHKADVWACGVALFVLMYNTFPFSASTLPALYQSIRAEPPKAVAVADAPLHALVLSMLSKAANERPSAVEVAAQLQGLCRAASIPTPAAAVTLPALSALPAPVPRVPAAAPVLCFPPKLPVHAGHLPARTHTHRPAMYGKVITCL